MTFNEGQEFFGIKGRREKGYVNENQNAAHRTAYYLSVLEGMAPPTAAITPAKRFLIRDKAKTLTPRQRESLAMLVVALDQDESYIPHLLSNDSVIDVIKRISN